MKREIEDYVSRDQGVVEVTEAGAVVLVPESVQANRAVAFRHAGKTSWGRVTRRLGSGKAEVQLLHPPSWLLEAEIEVMDASPSLPLPWDVGPIGASSLTLQAPGEGPPWPPRQVAMMELSGKRRAVDTGIEAIDLLAPIVGGGFNLVIDAQRGREGFDALVSAAFDEVDLDVRVADEESDLPAKRRLHAEGAVEDYEAAMAGALAWVAHERHTRSSLVVVMELPVMVAEYDVSRSQAFNSAAQIADAVSSTKGCEVTCLVRLPAATGPDGFADIVETLSLGEVDAQIFIDGQGMFDPGRSHSSAPLDEARTRARTKALATLHKAARAGDRLSLWGDDDLEPEELEAIERADAWKVSLAGATGD